MYKLLQQSLIYDNSSNTFYDPDFQQVLDSHLEYFKKSTQTQESVINTEFQGKFTGDFYAILNNLQIPAKYHRVILLMNGYTNPIQYAGDRLTVLVPDLAEIESLLMLYNASKSKLKLGIQGD